MITFDCMNDAGNDTQLLAQAERLASAAHGGRVAHSGFLEPEASARLVHDLVRRGVPATAWGGRPGARRRVVTARPSHVPQASTRLTAVYFGGVGADPDLRQELVATGIDEAQLGDLVAHQEGTSVVTLDPPPPELLGVATLTGRPVEPRVVPLERALAGRVKALTVVVPSLRVDVVGAKGFRVSRSYFSKGIAGGKVSVNGVRVGKAGNAEVGDEVYAEGLGRLRLLSVDGETRRGNVKLTLEVESAD